MIVRVVGFSLTLATNPVTVSAGGVPVAEVVTALAPARGIPGGGWDAPGRPGAGCRGPDLGLTGFAVTVGNATVSFKVRYADLASQNHALWRKPVSSSELS